MSDTVNQDACDLAGARAGNQEAFARLFDRHGPVVLSLCRQRGLAEADDAMQETFVRAYRMLDRLDDPARLRPWLYGIARRVCSERLRARRRRTAHEQQAGMGRATHTSHASVGDRAEQNEQLDRLGDALQELDERQRLAIHLYYLEQDPVAAAANALGLTRSGYYKLLARARERLAELLGAMSTP